VVTSMLCQMVFSVPAQRVVLWARRCYPSHPTTRPSRPCIAKGVFRGGRLFRPECFYQTMIIIVSDGEHDKRWGFRAPALLVA
jgi:hypothetical protein